MNRHDEIRRLLRMTSDEVRRKAGKHLVVCNDIGALHQHMAEAIAAEIADYGERGEALRLIVPVGPTGQYPLLARLIAERRFDLSHVWWFFMDEYCDEAGKAFDSDHPLSFKGTAEALFFAQLPEACGLNREQIFFPNEGNITDLAEIIENLGGIHTCYGGIGIHGHVAFNEPEPGVAHMSCRKVRLNDFTVTINAIRAQVGGNVENFPRYAYTLGMKEILSARRIRLYCRNGIDLDWANTVLRLALFGEPGDDYPVTYIRNRDYIVITDEDTLKKPTVVL